MGNGWIGVDLDGTLAHYEGWVGVDHIGEPIPAMVERVKGWLAEGIKVKIFTARVSTRNSIELLEVLDAIDKWCRAHIGQPLEVTCEKDYGMYELWDDRAVTVEANTGKVIMHPKGEATP